MLGNPTIVLAGATGNLGGRIARSLLKRNAGVTAIVRQDSSPGKVDELRQLGATIAEADYNSVSDLAQACAGGACVVSALAGLRDAMVDAQTQLLDAAIQAGVPRFIPSDFAIDFMKLPAGMNRNLDFRREFHERLDRAPIAATSILNGMFTDLLTGPAPVVLFKFKRILYWENADQLMDFTTVDDTAVFTAAAALDPSTPTVLRISGDQVSARGLRTAASEVTGQEFKLFRAGGLGRLGALITVMRKLMPGTDDVYPPWQGMQYLHNMFSGRAKLEPLDNDRYGSMQWTTVEDVLVARDKGTSARG